MIWEPVFLKKETKLQVSVYINQLKNLIHLYLNMQERDSNNTNIMTWYI